MQWKRADTRSSGEKEWQKKNYSFFLRLSVLSVTSFSILLMCLRVFNSIENLGYLKKSLRSLKFIVCLKSTSTGKEKEGSGGCMWMLEVGLQKGHLCVSGF